MLTLFLQTITDDNNNNNSGKSDPHVFPAKAGNTTKILLPMLLFDAKIFTFHRSWWTFFRLRYIRWQPTWKENEKEFVWVSKLESIFSAETCTQVSCFCNHIWVTMNGLSLVCKIIAENLVFPISRFPAAFKLANFICGGFNFDSRVFWLFYLGI